MSCNLDVVALHIVVGRSGIHYEEEMPPRMKLVPDLSLVGISFRTLRWNVLRECLGMGWSQMVGTTIFS